MDFLKGFLKLLKFGGSLALGPQIALATTGLFGGAIILAESVNAIEAKAFSRSSGARDIKTNLFTAAIVDTIQNSYSSIVGACFSGHGEIAKKALAV